METKQKWRSVTEAMHVVGVLRLVTYTRVGGAQNISPGAPKLQLNVGPRAKSLLLIDFLQF